MVNLLKTLSRQRDHKLIRENLKEQNPVDLADGIARLTENEALSLLSQLDEAQVADILIELPEERLKSLLTYLPDSAVAYYLDILPMDDAVWLHDIVGEERFEALLNVIPREDAQEIRRLLTYPEESVGRLMTEAFFEVTPDMTMQDVLDDIRRSPEKKYELVNDVYVLGEDDHLVGVMSLKKVIRSSPSALARDIMNTEPIICQVDDLAEDAARKMARYGFYALPVLNTRGQMLGVLTGDDAQDIIREADTEDMLKLGAVVGNADSYASQSVWTLYKRRMPWLLALFMADSLTGSVMRYYQGSMNLTSLTLFIPLIIGTGGNSGSQITTTITRALAVGEIRGSDIWFVIRRELMVGLFLGVTLGLCGFFWAWRWSKGRPEDFQIQIVVGLAIPAIVLWSSTIGSMLPITARRVGIDPAVMSAPFISTFVDATGLIIYFEIAERIIHHL